MDENTLVMAEALALAEVNASISKIRSKISKAPDDFNGECIDCTLMIEKKRLLTGAMTCILCQVEREHIAATSKHPRVYRTP